MSLLTLETLSVTRGGRNVFHDISLQLNEGEVIGLIGPNGAGKTTLMRAALGLLPHGGRSSLAELSATDRARSVAWMPQSREIAWPVSVETVVTLGRLPHLGAGQRPGPADRAAIDRAIVGMELSHLRTRPATELSGGEQTRVLIARALAQGTPLLMADEPIAGLDPAHQIATMQTFVALAGQGQSVLVSLHDLGLAVRHCTRLLLLSEGRLVADGPPAEVMTPERIAEVFGISAWYRETEHGPVYQPLEVVR